jgi:general secretion pathway protein H
MPALPGHASGFSLVETLVVLALVGLAAGALPRLGGPGQAALARATAEEVAATLREARAEALRTGRPAQVVFDTAAGAFARPGEARPPRRLPAGASLAVEAPETPGLPPGRAAIAFDPEGGSRGGRVRVLAGGAAAGAEVDWMTGHVRLHR